MNWFEKVSEKLGIIEEEEYDDEVEATEQQRPVAAPVNSKQVEEPAPIEEVAEQEEEIPEVFEQEKKKQGMSSITMKLRQNFMKKGNKNTFENVGKSGMKAVEALAQALHVVILEPKDFDDSQKIADILKDGQPVILNFEDSDMVIAKRISDFVAGVVFALGGSMKMIGHSILLCAPSQIDIESKDSYSDD